MKHSEKKLVLIGGGHSHALVLQRWASHPAANTQVTLVSPHPYSPYSGMLPGLLAGHYDFAETHIDLQRLCQKTGTQFIQQAVTAIDHLQQQITLANGQQLPYDVASINIGSTPDQIIPGSKDFATPVKPIAEFLQHWARLRQDVEQHPGQRITVIGGGAGSIEITMALAHVLKSYTPRISLVTRATDILKDYPSRIRKQVRKALRQHQVELLTDLNVSSIAAQQFFSHCQGYPFDHLFLCTQASAAGWLHESGLATDEYGFLQVNKYLQTLSADNLLAAGDCIHFQPHPLAKAGVYAVREADTLFHNLKSLCMGQTPVKPYRPQRNFLSLLALGGQYALGSKYGFSFSGHWVWRWKDRIDRRFMAQFISD